MNSIILLRVSTKEQNEQLQRTECLGYNKAQKWSLLKIFNRKESAYKNEDVWQEEIKWTIDNEVKHIIVWNMDRYSREPEDIVLDRIKMLSLMHNIQIHAVHGDAWSEIAETIGKINTMGFIGKALAEFLETITRGLEHQRAHKESKTKAERVKLAMRTRKGKTFSYKGKKWGRKSLPKQTTDKIIEAHKLGKSIRQIASEVKTTDKNNNQKNVSKSAVHKVIGEYHSQNTSL